MIDGFQLITRTFLMCFLMEIGSASNFTIAALANNSPKWVIILIAGFLGILLADFFAIRFIGMLNRLPINSNLISGVLMVSTGVYFLWSAK